MFWHPKDEKVVEKARNERKQPAYCESRNRNGRLADAAIRVRVQHMGHLQTGHRHTNSRAYNLLPAVRNFIGPTKAPTDKSASLRGRARPRLSPGEGVHQGDFTGHHAGRHNGHDNGVHAVARRLCDQLLHQWHDADVTYRDILNDAQNRQSGDKRALDATVRGSADFADNSEHSASDGREN